MNAPFTLDDYRAVYESLRRRARIAIRYTELGPKRPRGQRDWQQLALSTSEKLYRLSVKIGTIAWNTGRVGNGPRELRQEIDATRLDLIERTHPLDAIEAALGTARLGSPTPDDVLSGALAMQRRPHHGPSGV